MIHAEFMADCIIRSMAVNTFIKVRTEYYEGFFGPDNPKLNRLAYNLFEASTAALMFSIACSMKSQTYGVAHTWQKIVIGAIMATPMITRAIAYFCSKQKLDKADRVDAAVGPLMSLANVVSSLALMLILRPSIATCSFVCGILAVSVNIGTICLLVRRAIEARINLERWWRI